MRFGDRAVGVEERSAHWGLPYRRALDGVRGLAVVAVLLYHQGFRWARGGYLGVTVFFVLSGFLITGLLVTERRARGSIALRHFWGRRARRLAPGLLVLMAALVALVTVGGLRHPGTLTGDAVAGLAWMENWRLVFAHAGYAGAFSGTSPLQHLWSLGIEEQFYLCLPLVAVLALGRRGSIRVRRLALVLLGALAASALLGVVLYHPGGPIGRVYFGTDTRIAEPIVGALLALAVFGRTRSDRRIPSWAFDAVGLLCLGGLLMLISRVGEYDPTLYRGGLLAAALLSAGVVLAANQPRGVVPRMLGAAPLAALGKISYGIYLFHWPIFLWLTGSRTGLSSWSLFELRAAVTVGVAAASYALVEAPIRAGRVPWRIAIVGWADIGVASIAALSATTLAAPAVPNLFASGRVVAPPPPVVSRPTAPIAKTSAARGAPMSVAPRPAPVRSVSAGAGRSQRAPKPGAGAEELGNPSGGGAAGASSGPQAPPAAASPNALRVVVVGDSLANNLAGGLEAWAHGRTDVVVYNLAIGGCPISRGGRRRLPDGSYFPVADYCPWWGDAQSQRSTYFAQFNPQVVVMEDGINELPDRWQDNWSAWRHTGQAKFDQWLLSEYSSAIAMFTSNGAKLIALNAVCADWETIGRGWEGYTQNSEGDTRVASLDRTTSALAAYGARVGDLFSNMCPHGQFSQTVDGVSDARPDGYHLTDAAAQAVANQWLGPLVLSSASVVTPRAP